MPTIEVSKKDMETLLGETLPLVELEKLLPLAKAELKDYDEKSGDIKIELNDTNRPDLWSLEGLVRQFSVKRTGSLPDYAFFEKSIDDPAHKVIVSSELERIRPYIGAFAAIGPAISEDMLIQMIQTQEKLSENFGQSRKSLSIGIYEYENVTLPVRYIAVDPQITRFIPLGFEEEMDLSQILEKHPKGIDYANILEGFSYYPYLIDNQERVLSFPPIINSRRSGEIKPGEQKLFIEATGTDINSVILGLNIFACNLADRGFEILPMVTEYPFDTPFGKNVRTPYPLNQSLQCNLTTFARALGKEYDAASIADELRFYGIKSTIEDSNITSYLPSYRADYLHPVDLIEDFAMSVGYNAFEPIMPSDFTVGKLSPSEEFLDKVRHLLIGYGFEEIISNVLISSTELAEKMDTPDIDLVEVANPMSLAHATLRNRILPSLLRVEASSAKSAYPHRMFEVGEVVIPDQDDNKGTRTLSGLAAIVAHPTSNFSEIDSYLTVLMHHLDRSFIKKPDDITGYIPGRAGRIIVNNQAVGIIGELAPSVLNNWNINIPISVIEIDLDLLHHI